MPLMKSKSKKAFEHNIKAEMRADKPQDQALAIAYSIKRKAAAKKAKMAAGGRVESGSRDLNMADGGMINAKNEKRPMPSDLHDDSRMAHENMSRRPNGEDGVLDKPTVRQAQSNSSRRVMPIKRPNIVQGSNFKVRTHDEMQDELHNQEADLQSDEGIAPRDHDRQGPQIRDMADEHSTHRKPYAKGGEVESSDYDRPENKYEDDLQDLDPSMDEGSAMADSHDEMGANRQGPQVPDMEEPHNDEQSSAYAEGGEVNERRREEDGIGKRESLFHFPKEENDEDESASLAAAIMAKRKMMARGGEIKSHDSIYSDDSDQADLSRNADEDANEEDQLSFNALEKENYSESPALRQANHPEDSNMHSPEHDEMDVEDRSIVSQIRNKMKKKSPIAR